jgi:hypothetical protein
VLLAVGALASAVALGVGFYEFRTGRLLRTPFRRKVPSTPEDVRKNGVALVLNELGALLTDAIILSMLLASYEARPDAFAALSYLAVGGAGFTAVFFSIFTSLKIRGEVHYQERSRAASFPSAQP